MENFKLRIFNIQDKIKNFALLLRYSGDSRRVRKKTLEVFKNSILVLNLSATEDLL